MATLGVDLGTGKVAVVVLDDAGAPLAMASAEHHADLVASGDRHEQDAQRLLDTAATLVAGLPAAARAAVVAVGFTGQMHGVVLHDDAARPCSPLVTWRDQRTTGDAGLAAAGLHPGYGLATIAWWTRHGELRTAVRASTIHGLCATAWGGLERAPLDPTDVHAWGGAAALAALPPTLQPLAVDHGAMVGSLTPEAAARLGLRAGIPLAAPLGDNQASLRATLVDPLHELAFTLGTGCQLSAVVPRGVHAAHPGCAARPYDDTHDALVAASLSGGATWRWLADTAAAWATDLGLPPVERDAVFARLDALGLAATDTLEFANHLAGERHAPDLRGVLSGLSSSPPGLGTVARAVARGIARGARAALPAAAFNGRQRVLASGNALRRSALLRTMAEAEFALPLVLVERAEEAACGAALVARGVLPH